MNKVNQIITDRMIEAIETSDTLPWQKGWSGPSDVAVNHAGKPYRGINIFILHFAKMAGGYKSNFWLTPNQVRKMGGTIRKGEKVQYIIFWSAGKEKSKYTDANGVEQNKRPFMLRYYKVVNLEQTEGVKRTKKMALAESLASNEAQENKRDIIEDAEAILAGYLAQDNAPSFAEDGGDRAYYVPAEDGIHIPKRDHHHSDHDFYATAFHEVGHSTGHESRLKREGILGFDHFGSSKYSKEELVAEMTSVMLASEAGIVDQTFDNSTAYLKGWLSKIKADPTVLIAAAGQAQKAVDLVMGTTFAKSDDE